MKRKKDSITISEGINVILNDEDQKRKEIKIKEAQEAVIILTDEDCEKIITFSKEEQEGIKKELLKRVKDLMSMNYDRKFLDSINKRFFANVKSKYNKDDNISFDYTFTFIFNDILQILAGIRRNNKELK